MKTTTMISTLAAIAMLTAASLAHAQESQDPRPITKYGMSAHAGGGVGGFTAEKMRDITGTAGFWEARLMFGTRLPGGIEVAYIGGLQTIEALGLDDDARLLTTGVEGTARLNIIDYMGLQPYAFVGLGWHRFSLDNVETNQSSVEDNDDTMSVPLGLGVAYRFRFFIADVRGTYRPIFNNDLVPEPGSSTDKLSLDTWNVAAHVGFEF